MFYLGNRSRGRLDGVHPQIIACIENSLAVSPIDFGIPRDGGVRTAERQREMYEDPDIETKCDGFVNISRHQIPVGCKYGMAFDFYAYLNGKPSWDDLHMALVAGVILATNKQMMLSGEMTFSLRWGGTFGSDTFHGWDKAHMEAVV